MTPWQFGLCLKAYSEKIEARRKGLAWHAWHVSMMGRCSKMPSFKQFIGKQSNPKTVADDLKNTLKTHLPIRKKNSNDR